MSLPYTNSYLKAKSKAAWANNVNENFVTIDESEKTQKMIMKTLPNSLRLCFHLRQG